MDTRTEGLTSPAPESMRVSVASNPRCECTDSANGRAVHGTKAWRLTLLPLIVFPLQDRFRVALDVVAEVP